MKGRCRMTNAVGVVTHVQVENEDGEPFTITVEEYVDQDIAPDLTTMRVCDKEYTAEA